jgi:two-component system invasion response regulator UvrY
MMERGEHSRAPLFSGFRMKRLLIVGSHDVVRAGLKVILDAQSEITFGEANTASEAFQQVQEQEWDAVILDLSLGERSALEIQNKLREIRPSLPALLLGTLSDPEYARRLFKVGASGYVTKDSPSAELVTAVSKVVKGGKYISPALAERIIGYLAPGSEKSRHATLSPREYEVLMLFASGKTIREIAMQFSRSEKTISTYRARILDKMKMKSTGELIHYAVRNNLVD